MNRIQFDGIAVPNPGQMGIGVVLIEDDKIVHEISRKLPGVGTNNIAEYAALNVGINMALGIGWKHIIIEGDSKLVINQLNGTWKVKQDHLKKLYYEISKNLSKFDSFILKWIPREQNSIADKLASEALGYGEDPYHFRFKNKKEVKYLDKKYNIEISTECPRCKKECIFTWQEFKGGTHHIRQECPHHGFIRYAPKVDPYLSAANLKAQNNAKEKHQKNLLNF